jgi:beta-N-acetylhexosaminidase
MTLREQVGRLFMLGFTGTTVSPELAQRLADRRPAGVILFARNLEHPEQIARLTNALQEQAAGSPLLIAIDQEGGRVSRLPSDFTIFPPSASFGVCRSPELTREAAAVTARELRAVGINMNMAPVLDIHSNEANPIIGDRAFSAAAETVSELGAAAIAGLQDNRVVACGKHFPGHGETSADSHKELPTVGLPAEQLRHRELKPFVRAIACSVGAIMTAHVRYPALDPARPATLSPAILTDLLRTELGFDGVTVTDDLEMRAILDHHGIEEAAVQAVQAGADLLLICQDPGRQAAAMDAVAAAVEDGTIPRVRLEASLRRLAALKARFLLPYAAADPGRIKDVVGIPSHRRLVDTILETRERRLKASV